MKEKAITFVTNLPIWSIAEGVGAPSMYLTVHAYLRSFNNVNYITTESKIDKKYCNFTFMYEISRFCLLKMKNPLARRLVKYPNWVLLNMIVLLLLFWKRPRGIIYAYEIFFVPAAKLYTHFTKDTILITRFQGTILGDIATLTPLERFTKFFRKFDHFVALKLKSDLVIMTDDGTKGDEVLKYLRNTSKTLFVKNGVGWPDTIPVPKTDRVDHLPHEIDSSNTFNENINFYTCCRLNSWKRVDRAIELFKKISDEEPRVHLNIIGDGPEMNNLVKQVKSLGIDAKVTFAGAIPQYELSSYLKDMDFFISLYELSNVGNPLWEAILYNAKVITISNGETNKYITNLRNGFIQPETTYLDNADNVVKFIKGEIHLIEKPTLPSDVVPWHYRLSNEIQLVKQL